MTNVNNVNPNRNSHATLELLYGRITSAEDVCKLDDSSCV